MIKFDYREFNDAIRFVMRASKKEEAVVLNKAALTALIGGKGVKGAVQLTPKADLGKITRDRDKIIRHYMSKGIKRQEAVRLYNLRRRARGYTAGPGWHNSIVKLGGRGVRRQSGFSKSKAADASATRATPRRLIAEFENSAPAATIIGRQALQQGLNNAARDMVKFWTKRMQKGVFNKVNAR